jgi:hypothetical protein
MLGKNLSLLFYLKKPKSYEGGPMPVYLRITIDNDLKELCTSRKCKPGVWDKKAGRVKGKNEEARELNSHLNTFSLKAFEARQLLIEERSAVTALAIKNLLTGKKKRQRRLWKSSANTMPK